MHEIICYHIDLYLGWLDQYQRRLMEKAIEQRSHSQASTATLTPTSGPPSFSALPTSPRRDSPFSGRQTTSCGLFPVSEVQHSLVEPRFLGLHPPKKSPAN